MSTTTIKSGDKIFDSVNNLFMALVLAVTLFPLWFVIIASFSDPDAINRGEVIIWIKDFDMIGYEKTFQEKSIWIGYLNTIIYTIGAVAVTLVVSLPFAYALSRRDFRIRKFLTGMMLITWYFHGGLIPMFLLVKSLGLYNTRLVMMLLGAFGVWNIVIARTFFRNTIPEELWEASLMDGCNHFHYFFKVVLPLSKAIIVVLILFRGVAEWNEFFKGLVYIQDEYKRPLQLILRSILLQSTATEGVVESLDDIASQNEKERLAGIIRYCVVILGAAPLLIIYPFLQKYFMQGVMIGSVKG